MPRDFLIRLAWIPALLAAYFCARFLSTSGSEILLGILGLFLCLGVLFWLPEPALPVVLILTLALGSAYRTGIAVQSFYLRFLVLGLIALRGFLRLHRGPKTEFSWVYGGLFLFSLLGLGSSVYSVAPWMSFQRAGSFLLFSVVVFHYFWVRAGSVDQCEEYGKALWTSGVIILGVGFSFLLLGVPGMFRGGRLRLILWNPNQLGNYCALLFPIAIWFLLDRARGKTRWVAWGLFAALGTALIWSGSRAALVSATAALLVQFFFCYRKKLAVLAAIALVAGAFHVVLGNTRPDVESDPSFFEEHILRDGQLTTGSGRTDVWKVAGRLIDRRPLWGYGFGSVERLFEIGYFPELRTFQGGHVHNSYLEELVNLGWLGAAPLFGVIAYFLVGGVVMLLGAGAVTARYRFAGALYAVILAGCISGIFESWFTSVGSVFCFPFWFSGMLFLKMTRNFNDGSAGRSAA